MFISSAIASGQDRPGEMRPPIRLRGLPQTGIWRDAMTLLGHGVRPLAPFGLPGQATLRGIRGLGTVAVIERAPGFLDADKARRLRRALGVRHLIVQSDRAEEAVFLQQAGFRQIAAPVCLMDLDLTRSTADLMAAMSTAWRDRLARALGPALGVARAPLPPDTRHWLLAQLATPAHQPGPARLSPREIAAVCAVRPGAGQVITVRRKGALMAVILFLRHGAAATCQIAWTSEAGRAASAGHLAVWRAMLELRHLGVHRLTLRHRGRPGKAHLSECWAGIGGQVRMIGGHWLDTAWLPRGRGDPGAMPPVSLANGAGLALR